MPSARDRRLRLDPLALKIIMDFMEIPSAVPVLPIRNAVIFPGASMPLVIGRPQSVRALNAARAKDNLLLVVTQHTISPREAKPKDLYRIGVLCKIETVIETETENFQVVITGLLRYRIVEFTESHEMIMARGESVSDIFGIDAVRSRALFNSLRSVSADVLSRLPGGGDQLARLVERLDDPSYLTNLCASYLNIPAGEKQQLLEEILVEKRMETLLKLMQNEREVLNVQRDIQDKMSERLSKTQREALLREQIRTIREELGEDGSETTEDLRKKVKQAELPDEARRIAEDELKRLESLPPASAEYHVIRTYLDWLVEMPWRKSTVDFLDLNTARTTLDEDHYGLDQVKKRILQYLAVAKLKNDLHGPILCLVGPPGVGKTSLGQSIARCLKRKFIRASLGGIRDEAEIRGHRRTYIGAMPGRIIQSIKRSGVNNPLFMLDEIDKLGVGFQGDPGAALLEVLDPEQNKQFVDHYLDVAFDLSNVFFIATANVTDTIPPALLDRMEIIEVSGYTTIEKLQIARRYLIPRQIAAHGLSTDQVELSDETLRHLITNYTREAGVRELTRQIAATLRACAEKIVLSQSVPIVVKSENLFDILGPAKFYPEVSERIMRPGLATGLAWTPHGGDIIFIEASIMPGTGKLTLTGSLGDVMKESAQIAMSIVRSKSHAFSPSFIYDKNDIHIHVPSGAIPKDGPSAGVTILTALASLLSSRSVDPKLAMTGEITLRGAVLPVGGIKEKVLAAHRAGIEKLLLPVRNEPDLSEVPQDVRAKLSIQLVSTVEQVLQEALGLAGSNGFARFNKTVAA